MIQIKKKIQDMDTYNYEEIDSKIVDFLSIAHGIKNLNDEIILSAISNMINNLSERIIDSKGHLFIMCRNTLHCLISYRRDIKINAVLNLNGINKKVKQPMTTHIKC